MGWTVRGSNPGGDEIFCTCPDWPWGPPNLYNGYRVFPGGKQRPGRDALLVPWSWKGRTIPLLPPWAVRPVQSFSACTRVTFTCPTYLFWRFFICFIATMQFVHILHWQQVQVQGWVCCLWFSTCAGGNQSGICLVKWHSRTIVACKRRGTVSFVTSLALDCV